MVALVTDWQKVSLALAACKAPDDWVKAAGGQKEYRALAHI